MSQELTNLFSSTERSPNTGGYTLLDELPSFRHRVLKMSDSEGVITYVKKYVDDDSFCTESRILSLIGSAEQPFVVPQITASLVEERINALSEVKGAPLRLDAVEPAIIENLGQHLRGFHDGLNPQDFPAIDYGQQLRIYEELIETSDQIPAEDMPAMVTAIESLRQFFEEEQREQVVVHADFNHSNVLYDDTEERFGLIDFERTAVGYPSTDLARCAWRILSNDPDKILTLLQAYYDTKDISPEQVREFQAMQTYDFLGAVAYYALEGYKKNYPYYTGAVESLKSLTI